MTAKWKKPHERTSFTHTQHEELEALFSCNMFPDKNLQRELALKLNLPASTVKIWFRNRWFKKRKQQWQQEQQSLKPPNQVLPAKNVPTASTSPHSFLPAVSDSYSSHSPQPLDPFHWAGDSIITEIATSDVQMQDPQLERLVASVPALYSDAYDIAQIMELYSFPAEDEIASSSFHSLYHYLSPTRPS
ncbi:arginine-fifty homeobox [Eschrichtius robustus]